MAVDEHVGVVGDLLPDGEGETLVAVDGVLRASVALPGPARVMHALFRKGDSFKRAEAALILSGGNIQRSRV